MCLENREAATAQLHSQRHDDVNRRIELEHDKRVIIASRVSHEGSARGN